jgi:hypothetical protein
MLSEARTTQEVPGDERADPSRILEHLSHSITPQVLAAPLANTKLSFSYARMLTIPIERVPT